MEKYINRLIEREMTKKLHSSGCVLVKGPKFSGKSTMCQRFSSSVTALKTKNQIALIESDPVLALKGEKPHLIDEWQKVPEVWNLIRDDLDKEYIFGKFILTGSTTPADPKKIYHSGAGRISSLVMRPMSLYESGESDGRFSLKDIFSDGFDKSKSVMPYSDDFSLSDVAYLICRGGWPISVLSDEEYAIDVTKNYYDGLFANENESDEFAEFIANKDIELLKAILKSYARNVSTQVKNSAVIGDVLKSEVRRTLDEDTFKKYKNILENLFVIFEMPSWNLNLRSSVSVRVAPTYHFFDTSIATAALGITPSDLLSDLNSFGFFFEDMAIRDLSVYCSPLGAALKHYRDSVGREVDAILEMPNGEYMAIEVKIYSESNIKSGVSSLLSFQSSIIKDGRKPPKRMMILTSHGPSYVTEEGVYVISINHLKD